MQRLEVSCAVHFKIYLQGVPLPGNCVQTIPITIYYGINTTIHYTEHIKICAFLADDDVEELVKNSTVVCLSIYNKAGTRYESSFYQV
jgi:hypothetical protein